MDMMREAIEKRASETLAAEDGGPFLKGKIRRDDGRAAFVTLAEYFEEKLRAGLRERHIAEFVNDEQFDGGELRLEFQETPLVARGGSMETALSGQDRRSHQKAIDGVRGLAALANRPEDQGLAAPHEETQQDENG